MGENSKGAEWLRRAGVTNASPLGENVANLIDDLLSGIYHLSGAASMDWSNAHYIEIRVAHPEWARSLRDQCGAAGVAFFFKQWGEYAPSPWNKLNPKSALAVRAVGLYGSSVYAQVGHVAGFRYPDEVCMERVGKKAAGRLLDGVEWSEVPA